MEKTSKSQYKFTPWTSQSHCVTIFCAVSSLNAIARISRFKDISVARMAAKRTNLRRSCLLTSVYCHPCGARWDCGCDSSPPQACFFSVRKAFPRYRRLSGRATDHTPRKTSYLRNRHPRPSATPLFPKTSVDILLVDRSLYTSVSFHVLRRLFCII